MIKFSEYLKVMKSELTWLNLEFKSLIVKIHGSTYSCQGFSDKKGKKVWTKSVQKLIIDDPEGRFVTKPS